ncbi:MAG: copper resistance protein NlpE [Bacteroidales bacterium]|nr:copper resistance protein NlpE [Bacteroidales bacterium]
MKQKIFLLLTIVAILFSACKKTGTKEESPMEDSISVTTEVSDSHTSEIALDWEGEYKGILPCADCDGMEISLFLNPDNTFTQSTNYIGKGGPYEENGTFSWDEVGGIVILKFTDGSEAKYKVEENSLVLLDEYGYPYAGDEYVLRK